MSLLACTGIVKRFEGVVALDGVALHVEPGEVVGLVGPNGSGKTTLLSVIAGSLKATTGLVELDGADITRTAPHQRAHMGIARTFQVPRPLRSSTVIENVALASMFGRGRRSRRDSYDRAADVLTQVGLSTHARMDVGTLTLHERKFLEIARALAVQPRLLLLDEVLGGLNPTEAQSGLALIARIRDAGVGIVYIEHNVRAVTSIADRLYVLVRGRNLVDGPPREVIRDERVITAYLGSSHA